MATCALRILCGIDAKIIAVDVDADRRALARQLGASETVPPESARDAVHRSSPPGRLGCAGVVEATGNIALELAIASMADEGALSCIAPLYGTRRPVNNATEGGPVETLPVNLDILSERALRLSFNHGDPRTYLRHALALAASAAANTSGTGPLREAVTARLGLDDIEEAYALAYGRQAGGRVVIYPGREDVRSVGTARARYSQLD